MVIPDDIHSTVALFTLQLWVIKYICESLNLAWNNPKKHIKWGVPRGWIWQQAWGLWHIIRPCLLITLPTLCCLFTRNSVFFTANCVVNWLVSLTWGPILWTVFFGEIGIHISLAQGVPQGPDKCCAINSNRGNVKNLRAAFMLLLWL